ncbi:MAG: response regulator [Elusimicrobia bacterium]|nr:response regulator [Candidatus Liberimonas magnetica]
MKENKVLVVDDDTIFLDELKEMLVLSGYSAEGVSDSAIVVRTAEKIKPDVILLDLKMDGKSGFQVADDLKHFPATARIPIVAMTGYFTDKTHKLFMQRIGINDCIIKPFNPLDIITKIEQNLLKT